MKIAAIIPALFITLSVGGQQIQVTAFYDQYGVMYNPAMAGTGKNDFIGGSFRSQWSGMPGAPKTASLYGSVAFEKTKTGLGAFLYNDVTGPTSRTGAQLAYAYHIPMNAVKFSVGIEARVQQYSVDAARLQENLGGNDPVFAGGNNQLKGDAGLGFALTSEKFNVGVSVSQLVQSKFKWTSAQAQGGMYRHYFFTGSYTWKIDAATLVTPNLLMIYLPNAPVELQGGVRVEHDQAFWYGLSWRARQSWMLSAGIRMKKQFNIGYSFDMYNKPLSSFEGGSNAHEVMLRYDFVKNKG